MKTKQVLLACALGLLVAVSTPVMSLAQATNPLAVQVVPPPRAFKTAEEHFN